MDEFPPVFMYLFIQIDFKKFWEICNILKFVFPHFEVPLVYFFLFFFFP